MAPPSLVRTNERTNERHAHSRPPPPPPPQDFLKSEYSRRSGNKPTPIVGVGVGAVAGAVSTTVGFPLESARRRMQAQGTGGRPVLHTSIFSCMAGAAREGSLFQGCGANVLKMMPAQAITFGCMTVIVPALSGLVL
jgi:hypothetical protein